MIIKIQYAPNKLSHRVPYYALQASILMHPVDCTILRALPKGQLTRRRLRPACLNHGRWNGRARRLEQLHTPL